MIEKPLETARHYFELSNKSDFDGIESLFTEMSTYSSVHTGIYFGRNAIMEMQREFHGKFSSLKWKVHSVEEVKPGVVLFDFNFVGELLNGDILETSGFEYVIVDQGKIQHIEIRNKSRSQVITACAFIHHNFGGVKKVFLPKRAATKKLFPGVFELPGGHIDWNEDIVEGLKREILEEHSMRIKVGDPFASFTYFNEVQGSHSVEIIYFATFEDLIENIKINPEDHTEFKWISQEEIGSIGPISDAELRNVIKGLALLNGGELILG